MKGMHVDRGGRRDARGGVDQGGHQPYGRCVTIMKEGAIIPMSFFQNEPICEYG
jgi:hypothetical protein